MAETTVVSTSSNNGSLNLLGSMTRVEVPFIKVTFGDESNGYTFGVYDKQMCSYDNARRAYTSSKIKYPNYVNSLTITKINGQVNQYTLNLTYPITQNNDPNFFEKVFSSISESRRVVFSYGDLSMPTYVYRDEEAIVTNVTSKFNAKSPTIDYTVSAISSASLLNADVITLAPSRYEQPSKIIYELLNDKRYGLQDIFYGMRDLNIVRANSLIAQDDAVVTIESKSNISVLDYLTYLVSCMTPSSDRKSSISKSGVYVLNVVDDTSGIFQGPYFTVKKLSTSSKNSESLTTYTIDMGFPSQNIVTDFSVDNNETYSIYYNYTNRATQEEYRYRINDSGQLEPIYAPLLSSGNSEYKTTEADRTWWTAVTQYPICAQITLKGLLRPALLMSYLKLNMYYYGKKHISSGLYVISKQVDTVDSNGFKTTLSLVRVGSDDDTSSISYSYDTDYSAASNNSYSYVKTGD